MTTEYLVNGTSIRRGGDAGASERSATTRLGGHEMYWSASAWADGFRLVLYVKEVIK